MYYWKDFTYRCDTLFPLVEILTILQEYCNGQHIGSSDTSFEYKTVTEEPIEIILCDLVLIQQGSDNSTVFLRAFKVQYYQVYVFFFLNISSLFQTKTPKTRKKKKINRNVTNDKNIYTYLRRTSLKKQTMSTKSVSMGVTPTMES